MAFAKYFRKLMGWCSMDSLRKERQENFFSGFKSKNGNFQLGSSPAGLQESKVLKARVSFIDGRRTLWVLIIVFFTLIVSLLIWAYNSPEGSFLILFSGLIWFLLPLMFLLNHPNTVAVVAGKIIIRKTLRKPVMIDREDVTQITVTKNKDHSYR